MDLRKILTTDLIKLNLEANDKQGVIEELLDILMTTGKIETRDAALKALLEREEKMSTGIQHGVAIPHGKCEGVNELVACLGIKASGLDFKALDGEPSRIFIMTVSPVHRTGPHLQFLASISQLLKSKEQRDQILAAASPKDIIALF
ncbi:MAG: PTS sugar transporter subunit IIA [Spirochaetales bacterium]|nr:PTS sugar transporter subunit IIA [Spirochaetales bacterium]